MNGTNVESPALMERLDCLERDAHENRSQIGHLQRENRLLKRVGGVLLLSVFALGIAGARSADDPGDVVARSFALRDSEGRDRIKMFVAPGGTTGLILSDQSGKPRVQLRVNQ